VRIAFVTYLPACAAAYAALTEAGNVPRLLTAWPLALAHCRISELEAAVVLRCPTAERGADFLAVLGPDPSPLAFDRRDAMEAFEPTIAGGSSTRARFTL
jgi:hypothetical protein